MSTESGFTRPSVSILSPQRPELPEHLFGAGRALAGVVGDHPGDEIVEALRHIRTLGVHVGRRLLELRLVDLVRLLSLERSRARQELMSQDAHGVDVHERGRSVADVARQRLRRHVGQRARHDPVSDAIGVRHDEPEVHEHHPAARGEHHVGGLDVPVRQARVMDDRERVGNGQEQIDGLEHRERIAAGGAVLDHPIEAQPLNVLEDEKGHPAVASHRVNRDHARVPDRRERPTLAQQVVRLDLRMGDLEGDAPPQHDVDRLVDLPHPARTQEQSNLVELADDLAGREQRRLYGRGLRSGHVLAQCPGPSARSTSIRARCKASSRAPRVPAGSREEASAASCSRTAAARPTVAKP